VTGADSQGTRDPGLQAVRQPHRSPALVSCACRPMVFHPSVAAVSSARWGAAPVFALLSRHRTVEGAVAAAGGSLLRSILGQFGFVLAIRRITRFGCCCGHPTTKPANRAFATGRPLPHKLISAEPGQDLGGLFAGGAGAVVGVSDSGYRTSAGGGGAAPWTGLLPESCSG